MIMFFQERQKMASQETIEYLIERFQIANVINILSMPMYILTYMHLNGSRL
jgi:hypothetical protein